MAADPRAERVVLDVCSPTALTVRDLLEPATIGGARVLGWDRQIRSLEAGRPADIALA